MNDEPADPVAPAGDEEQGSPSPLRRIKQDAQPSPEEAEQRRALLASKASNRRYWVRLNVSPLGWVALVEQGESGGTSALGDVLDLGGGGCVMLLSNLPPDMLAEGREITVSLRSGPDQVVTCTGEVRAWQETPNGVQVRIAFTSADAAVRKQVADIALAARVRLLQISHGDEE